MFKKIKLWFSNWRAKGIVNHPLPVDVSADVANFFKSIPKNKLILKLGSAEGNNKQWGERVDKFLETGELPEYERIPDTTSTEKYTKGYYRNSFLGTLEDKDGTKTIKYFKGDNVWRVISVED